MMRVVTRTWYRGSLWCFVFLSKNKRESKESVSNEDKMEKTHVSLH